MSPGSHLRQSIPPGPLYVLGSFWATSGPQYRTFPKTPVWTGEAHSEHTPPLRSEPPFQCAPLLVFGALQSSGQSVPVAFVVAFVRFTIVRFITVLVVAFVVSVVVLGDGDGVGVGGFVGLGKTVSSLPPSLTFARSDHGRTNNSKTTSFCLA